MNIPAWSSETGRNLSARPGNADRALYRAKPEGRDRVAPPPVLVGAAGDEAPPPATAPALAPAIAPALAPTIVAPMIG